MVHVMFSVRFMYMLKYVGSFVAMQKTLTAKEHLAIYTNLFVLHTNFIVCTSLFVLSYTNVLHYYTQTLIFVLHSNLFVAIYTNFKLLASIFRLKILLLSKHKSVICIYCSLRSTLTKYIHAQLPKHKKTFV